MFRRAAFFFVPVALSALAACASGPHSNFTPIGNTPSFALGNAAVKETVLHTFAGGAMDGATPISGLLKVGNLLYGTSGRGGSHNKGTIFSISPSGANFTVLYSFTGAQDGSGSGVGLIYLGTTLYGTTASGGANGKGTVFSITPAGAFATLYSFKGGKGDGAGPAAELTGVRGTLYGTTADGGDVGKGACSNCGTVFSLSTGGQEKVLYFFGSNKDDGIGPASKLILADGKLYGTTTNGGIGGVNGKGTIFSVTTDGKEAVIYRFKDAEDGSCSFNCYLMNLNGTLYGTAYNGGANRLGSIFSITPGSALKTLYSASRKGNDGGNPKAALANAGGTLYGTMSEGPVGKSGTVFSIATSGPLTRLHTFAGGTDGAKPSARLLLVGKALIGTTAAGGSNNVGTIYSISGF